MLKVYRTIVAVGGNVCEDFDVLTVAHTPEGAENEALARIAGIYPGQEAWVRPYAETVEVSLDHPRAIAIEPVD